jgi:hypothetical protein
VNGEAKPDARVEQVLRVERGVRVHHFVGAHKAFVRVDGRIHHAVPDGLVAERKQARTGECEST